MYEHFTFAETGRFDRKSSVDRINESFPEVKIIMGIRSQRTWIANFCSEYLKGGGLLGFYDLVESFINNEKLDDHYVIGFRWFRIFISYLVQTGY